MDKSTMRKTTVGKTRVKDKFNVVREEAKKGELGKKGQNVHMREIHSKRVCDNVTIGFKRV